MTLRTPPRPADPADRSATLALLIDGDNASPKIVEGLLAEIATYGTASVKRIYGDWTKPNLGGWKQCLLEHSIQPIQQFAYTTGKNATDGAMIIDGMDLLYTGRFDGFCLVSSDSDFARLASRLREQGVLVYGFGERKTPRPFITACDKFVFFDVLAQPGGLAVPAPAKTPAAPDPAAATPPAGKATARTGAKASDKGAAPAPAKGAAKPTVPAAAVASPAAKPQPRRGDAVDAPARALLTSALAAVAEDSGWASLGAIGSHIAKRSPEFDSRNYGFARLSDLVEATGLFEVERSSTGKGSVLVRLK
ncbi:NYN domain-containing protein [Methylopila sp. 73B]|uniref:NYN domain-containing protein n=1 Tax=Methylopila sp. 73B TaxID=1120792 RepID=UPI00037F63C1|nr:NYN domain-containing protein [Methylopila sp. 73B]